jgi:Tfp pilus assembly protein PilF
VSAAVLTLRWLFTTRPFVRSAYLFDLLIPVALLSIGLVTIGASRIEALRQAAERESLLAGWAAQSAAVRIAAALELAQSGAVDVAIPRLEAAVDREMPESDVRAALPLLARWLAAEDLAPYGYFARGLLRMHAGQTQAGLADLATAVRSRPEEARWRGLYGLWLAKAGRVEDAYPLLRDAVVDPSCDPMIVLECGTLLLRRGEVREAEVLAEVAVRALPGASRPHAVLAAARFLAGSNVEASGALNAALQADSSDTLAHAVQAAVLLWEGSAREALTLVRDAAASTIERPGYLAALEGWALAELGYEHEAALAFAQAREHDPGLVSMVTRMQQGLLDRQLDTPAREIGRLLTWLAT